MRKRLAEIGILSVIFIIAVVVFSYLTNRGNNNMTADIGNATLPRVNFSCEGYGVNPLSGYIQKMDVTTMRDTITPVSNQRLDINIDSYDVKVSSIGYEIYTIDGKQKLSEGTAEKVSDKVSIELNGELLAQERVLVLTLKIEDENVYYYTRVVNSAQFNVSQCLDYAYSFHENALAKAQDSNVKTAIEPSSEGDNTTLQHVTIHSDFDHVTWGELAPSVIGTERIKIVETNPTYTSILMEYEVRCRGEENEEDTYMVKEFFRVRMAGEVMYLLNYDRTMEQVFDGAKHVLSEKGVLLGIAPYDLPYMVNDDGTIVSFIQANELWNYNKETDELSLLFSFMDAENTDVRNLTDDHEIKLLAVDKDGNTTFAVYGYMNRGSHEGKVGAAIYYYNIDKNSIDEKVFIPSNKSAAIASAELGKLVYYSISQEMLYVLVDGTLYEIDMEKDKEKKLVENLEDGQYTVSDDGHLVAYQSNGTIDEATKITVKDLYSGKEYEVSAADHECIKPLGFVNDDFICGTARKEDVGETITGETTIPMYKVEIRNTKNEIVKTYESGSDYVLDVEVKESMITLNRAVKEGNRYTSIAPEHITNNEKREESNISLDAYSTELKETQMRLTFADGIQDREAKVLKPKQVLFEKASMIAFDQESLAGRYYVYGYGRLQGIYKKAGYAVQGAETVSGVVVSSEQKYVWERGNRYLNYTITGKEDVINFIREQLSSGRYPMDVMNELSNGNSLDLSGCTTEEILYIVNRGTPVIGMADSQTSVILTGYDSANVFYTETATGNLAAVPYEQMDQMLAGTGRAFIGYIE